MTIENTAAVAADTASVAATDSANVADDISKPATVTGEGQGGADAGGNEGKDEAKKADSEADKPLGAPEKYEDFTLPEGYVLEGDRLDAVVEFAKEAGWTQEQAQKGVDQYLAMRQKEREVERGLWAEQSQTEFGKEFDGIAKEAKAAMVEAEKQRPGITDRLDATNLGNHPDVLWLAAQIGKLGANGKPVGLESTTTSKATSPAARLWPNLPEK